MSRNPLKVRLFPFPQSIVTPAKGCIFWERLKGRFTLEAHGNVTQPPLEASWPLLHLWLDFSNLSLQSELAEVLAETQTPGPASRVLVSAGLGRAWKPAFIPNAHVLLLLLLLDHSPRMSDLRSPMSLNWYRSGSWVTGYDSPSNHLGFCSLDLESFQLHK